MKHTKVTEDKEKRPPGQPDSQLDEYMKVMQLHTTKGRAWANEAQPQPDASPVPPQEAQEEPMQDDDASVVKEEGLSYLRWVGRRMKDNAFSCTDADLLELFRPYGKVPQASLIFSWSGAVYLGWDNTSGSRIHVCPS